MTLVIMAAGMGSRFGGLKQIEPVGPSGEIIIDYSIYDAINAGFDKVVFIIKEENYELFKEIIGDKISSKVAVEYVFQKNDNIKEITGLNIERQKPFGTAHAILCCKNVVKENFAIINSDDFYGRDAYFKIAEFLKNTTSKNGAVKRGVCETINNELASLIESSIEEIDGKFIATPLSGAESFELDADALVSMNMFGFTPKIFEYLENRLKSFVVENENNLEKCEYLIPEIVCEQVKNHEVKVKVLSTTSVWHGITYREDKEELVEAINNLVKSGEYPSKI